METAAVFPLICLHFFKESLCFAALLDLFVVMLQDLGNYLYNVFITNWTDLLE